MEQQPRRPGIADVAREAQVSKTAVSFAFNSPERLAPGTASRIRDVAEALGYRPHPIARMLTQRRTMTIGVLTPQALSVIFSNPFFGAFSEGVALAAEEVGYGIHFISPLHGSLARAVRRATADGVVVIGLSEHHPEVEQIRRAGLPMVLVDSTALQDLPSVEIDDEAGAWAAAVHLVTLGHRDIVVLGVEPPPPMTRLDIEGVTARRLRGYRAGLADAGIQLADERIVAGPATIDGGIAAMRRIWELGLRPTGVLAMSDALAIGAMRAIRDAGRSIPADVSVVGFDDIDLATHTDPPLTTVHQPIRQKGEEAVRLLLSIVEQRNQEIARHLLLATHLVVRGSTGAAPQGRREANDDT